MCVCTVHLSLHRTITVAMRTCIFIFMAERNAFLLFLGTCSSLHFTFNTMEYIQLSSEMLLYRICDWIILLSRTAVMMIESVSECGLVIQMKYADMNSLSLGKNSIFIIVLLFSCSEIQHHTDETSYRHICIQF